MTKINIQNQSETFDGLTTITHPITPNPEKMQSYISKIIETSNYSNRGPLVNQLESELDLVVAGDDQACVLTNNGTSALSVGLQLLKQQRCHDSGDFVISTPFTFPATINSIYLAGLKYIPSDIESSYLNLCPKAVEKTIQELPVKPLAILPVHVFGNLCDIEGFNKLSKKYNIPIIYDACHTFGVTHRRLPATCFGDVAVLSLHATKIMHSGEGGCLVVGAEDKDLVVKLSNFGIGLSRALNAGTNAKMPEFSAALGLSVLPGVNDEIRKRKEIYSSVVTGLKQKLKNFYPQFVKHPGEWNYCYNIFRFNATSDADNFQKYLDSRGIVTRRYFDIEIKPDARFKLKNFRKYNATTVAVPHHSQITRDEVDYLRQAILGFDDLL